MAIVSPFSYFTSFVVMSIFDITKSYLELRYSDCFERFFSFPKRRRRSFLRAFMGVVDELRRLPR